LSVQEKRHVLERGGESKQVDYEGCVRGLGSKAMRLPRPWGER
jgi:hypothetical protein